MVPIPPPSFGISWNEFAQRAFVAMDDDKIDKEWFIRNIVGGMSAGFGLRGLYLFTWFGIFFV